MCWSSANADEFADYGNMTVTTRVNGEQRQHGTTANLMFPFPYLVSYLSTFFILEPGDAYLFHAMTVHGAGGNSLSNRRRRGYTIRYTGDDVVYDLRPGLSQPLVCEDLATGQPLDSDRYPVLITSP